MSLLIADDVHLQFRGRALFEGATLAVERRDRLGIIGANGTGKSTFLKIMVGQLAPDSGRITRARGLRVGYLPQELPEGGEQPLIDSVLDMAPRKKDVEARLAEVEAELHATTDPDEQVAHAETLADLHTELSDLERLYGRHRAEAILAGLRFKPHELTQPLSAFSGGWRMRAALAGLLFMGPDVLMLDEPTNHLDMPSVQWLNGFLRDYPHALVLICHDREFLNRHITRVASLEVEGLRTYKGNYDEYRVLREQEIELLENRAKRQEARTKDLEAFVERFKAKASKARQAQSKAKQIEKLMEQAVDVPQVRRSVSLTFPPCARSGEVAVETRTVTHAYGAKPPVLNAVNVAAHRGDRVAIVGLNGAGKTTLLRILAGELPPSEGEVRLGYNVERSYFAQHHADVLRREATILEEVWRARPEASQTEARGICGAFLFSGDDVDKTIGVLSGGERARVALARMLAKPGNLLLLDEPTNHLDTESAERLTASLKGYDGTLLFVSHNLDFARQLSNKVWDVHDGIVEEYPGSLADYLDRLAGEDVRRASGQTSTAAVPAAAARAPMTMSAGASSAPAAPVDDRSSAKEARHKARQAESDRKKLRTAQEKKVAKAEADVMAYEAEVARLEGVLADPATHGDPAKGRELARTYEEAKKKLEVAMATWEREGEALAKLDAE
jgi:ATP-binding cassette subfamily F protein 3